ncbi:MAG: GNAT family N-acetyltransferase [Clostridia bacterium]|nr:GNAT family N-acetyltransferase [Clostridia bacterium]
MKANLREECWGRLVTDGFLFETGYDYYVHIGCDLPLDLVVPLACRYHLFVEEWSKVAVTLATERLILRSWDESDAEALYQYASDPEVGPPAGWQPHTSVENSREIIRDVLSAHETYAVCLAEDEDTPIGSIGLHRNDLACHMDEYELGYWLAKPFWGQGLIPEAAQEILRHAFEDLSMSRVWCGYYDGNVKSRRVQEKLGFTYHHTTEGIELPPLNETRIGHASLLTKEAWENLHE